MLVIMASRGVQTRGTCTQQFVEGKQLSDGPSIFKGGGDTGQSALKSQSTPGDCAYFCYDLKLPNLTCLYAAIVVAA